MSEMRLRAKLHTLAHKWETLAGSDLVQRLSPATARELLNCAKELREELTEVVPSPIPPQPQPVIGPGIEFLPPRDVPFISDIVTKRG